MDFLVWASAIVLLLCFIVWYQKRRFTYWEERRIPSAPAVPFIGSQLIGVGKPLHEVEELRYKTLGRIYGHYEGNRPVLMVGDPTLLKNILVKDFPFFINRRGNQSFGDRILDKLVSSLPGEDWKRVRTLITPAFSTGKIKKMTSIVQDSVETLCQNFKKYADSGKPVDAKRLYGAFTMDVIASAAFATKVDSHNDPDNVFVTNARNAIGGGRSIWFLIFFIFPKLMKIYRYFYPNSAMNFFKDMTLKIINERKMIGKTRNDFLQLMMEAGGLIENSEEKDEKIAQEEENGTDVKVPAGQKKVLSHEEVVAQCILFFLAGYETTASTLSYASYLLALNPDCQERLIKEIDETLANDKKNLTYEAVQSMKYLDCVISETLRLFPPAVRLTRQAVKDYELGYGGLTIPKGMTVGVPVYAIHHDPEFYPDPEKFNPDRFNPEAKVNRNSYTYLPFGAGPRNCLGMRFALMETKMCLAQLFSQFCVKRCPETKVPLEFTPGLPLLRSKSIVIAVEERTKKGD